MTTEVTLTPVTPADATLLTNLFELYLHDMSEIFPLHVGPDGRFGYERLPLFWSEPETRWGFFIRSGEEIAGFALVMRGSPASDDPEILDLSEFFVLRSYRRTRIGKRAAFLVWDRLPGRWSVRVAERNRGGLPFWDAAVAEYTGGVYGVSEYMGSQLFRVYTFESKQSDPPRAGGPL